MRVSVMGITTPSTAPAAPDFADHNHPILVHPNTHSVGTCVIPVYDQNYLGGGSNTTRANSTMKPPKDTTADKTIKTTTRWRCLQSFLSLRKHSVTLLFKRNRVFFGWLHISNAYGISRAATSG
jgi:hypothetical protein